MSTLPVRAVVRTNALPHLSRYRDPKAARALAERHPRLAELSVSFPALFAALATPRARFDAESAIAQVTAGSPLAVVAADARVPLWLRKLQPETCPTPLPALPDSIFLRRRMVNHLPADPRRAQRWFDAVAHAARWCGEPFMVWCARQAVAEGKGPLLRLKLLGLWAWFSVHPGTRAHGFIDRPWSQGLEIKAALKTADAWLNSAMLHLEMGEAPLADTWFAPGSMDGYDFVPLDCAAAVAAEAEAMENCLRTYGECLANNYARLWSVRRDGARVATMCVRWREQDPLPVVWELLQARNCEAPAELWLAARRWLIAQDLLKLVWRKNEIRKSCELDRRRWIEFWRPYWLDRGGFADWLPLAPSRNALIDL